MTDKEQIIIDGIQFNKFGDFYVDYDLNGKFQSISSSAKEYKILKSLIEQLARKTQECEKLKNQVDEDYNYYTTELKTLRDTISNKEKRNAELFLTCGRYRKTLEEIEEVCIKDTREFEDGTAVRYDSLDEILDIISKVKDGNE